MDCHRALGCGHASVANADAKRQPKLWLVARPLCRSLRGLLFSLCLGSRSVADCILCAFKRLRPNMADCFVLCTWGRASFLTKCPSCAEVRGWRSCHAAFLVALEKTNGCLVHVDFDHPLAIWDSASIPPLPRSRSLPRLSENQDRRTHPNQIVASKSGPDSGDGKRPRFWCQKARNMGQAG